MPNKERLAQVMNHILDNPKTWDQTQWHCGSSHCFAGWAQVFSGNIDTEEGVSTVANRWLGLNRGEHNLYASKNTLKDLWLEVDRLTYEPPDVDENNLPRIVIAPSASA